MEISEIKSQLTLKHVLDYYGLKPDKHLRLNCPFHADKTPSLQVYYKTHTAYCFSSNCPTHGKSLDVIDFILYMEGLHASTSSAQAKHEAIEKAKALITGGGAATPINTLTKAAVLTKMFTYFKNAVHNSRPAKEYLEGRSLDFEKLEVGYNSGQFHHGTRKDEALIKSCAKYGLLLDKGKKGRTGEPAYQPFGKGGISFALKNREGKITGLYFRSVTDSKKSRHFYLKDRQGLYPGYPKPNTTKLILTEAIIDAATLLQQETITKGFEVLSLYGTNGLTDEHTEAIKGLNELQEVVFWFDGDEAGNKAAEKYKTILSELKPGVKISQVLTPENEDVNSLLQGHSPDILTHLIETRKEYSFLFSSGEPPQADIFLSTEVESLDTPIKSIEKEKPNETPTTGLDTNNPYNLKYTGKEAKYQIKGFNIKQLDSLKITLQITAK